MKTATTFAALFATSAAFAAFNYEELVKDAERSGDGVAPISSIWQKEHAAELSAATTRKVIAACVESRDAADALLAEVKPAYETDPLAAYRIAEVTHYVMEGPEPAWYEFWRSSRLAKRTLWAQALIERARSTDDDYVKIFCIDQLRWCAFPSQAETVRALGEKQSPGVSDFAVQIAGELASRRE